MFKGVSQRQGFHGVPINSFGNNLGTAYGMSGLSYWLDAGRVSGVNFTPVLEWVDQIRGYKFSQPTAINQPRLILNDSFFNNHPSVETESVSRFMSAQDLAGIGGNTIAFVARYAFATGLCTLLGRSDNSQNFISLGGTSPSFPGVGARVNNVGLFTTVNDINPKIVLMGAFGIMINGTLINSTPYLIGRHRYTRLFFVTGGDNYLIGNIAEILFYDSDFSVEQALIVSQSLNSKYAIY